MSYIGKKPTSSFASATSQTFTGNNSTTAFTLNRRVSAPEDLEVFVSNIQQQPTTSYTIGSTGLALNFDSAPPSGEFYVVYRSEAGTSAIDVGAARTANANTFSAAQTFSGGISGNTTLSGDLTVDTTTLKVNSTNNNVGIGVSNAESAVKLEVNAGSDGAVAFSARSDGGNGNNRRFNLIPFADGGGANYGGGLKIQTRDSVNVFHNRITVQSNGKVGIGTTSPDAKLDVEGTTDAEIRITRTTASVSSASTDQGAVLHLFNDIEFENGYDGNAAVGQILFSSDDGSTGQGIRAKIACNKRSYSHSESLDFYVSPGNTTSGQASATSNSNGKRMTIDYAGRVGIATTPPGAEDTTFNNLHIGDQAAFGEYDGGSLYIVKNRYYNGSNWIAKENGGGSAINMDTSGDIHFQTSANVNAGQTGSVTTRATVSQSNGLLYVPSAYSVTTGTGANMYVQSNGAFYRSTSSRRYKNTIKDSTHGLTELLKLRSVTYKGNNDGDIVLGGLIAEEVHDAGLTEFVQYNDDNEPDALSYGNMVSLCVKAIQEQQEQIKTLEAKVAELESK